MTEHRSNFAKLVVACWEDDALLERLKSDPKTVLAEFDLGVPAQTEIRVHENTDSVLHITVPAKPSSPEKLSDEELHEAAGGNCCYSVKNAGLATN